MLGYPVDSREFILSEATKSSNQLLVLLFFFEYLLFAQISWF